MNVENFTSRYGIKDGENLFTVPLMGGRRYEIGYPVDICGVWVGGGGGGNEVFESWDPRVFPNRGMLTIADDSTSANFEKISS
ncbi:hypothetical protein FCV25MIE_34940, partial [Fagus crenata]